MKYLLKIVPGVRYRMNIIYKCLSRRCKSTRMYRRILLSRKPELSHDLIDFMFLYNGWVSSIHRHLLHSEHSVYKSFSAKELKVFSKSVPFPVVEDRDFWRRDIFRDIVMPEGQYLYPAIAYRHSILADPVVLWEMSRLQNIELGYYDGVFGNKEQDGECTKLIKHWILNNPYPKGLLWEVPLELALRAISLVQITVQIDPSDLRSQIEEIIWLCIHGLLKATLKKKTPPNNHRLAELAALALLLPTFPKMVGRYYKKTCELLNQEISNQFFIDGHNAECSSGYHAFSTEVILVIFRVQENSSTMRTLMKNNGLKLDLLKKAAFLAVEVSFLYQISFGRSPNYGDSSDSRFLPGSEIMGKKPRDHSYILDIAGKGVEREKTFLRIFTQSGYGYFASKNFGVCAFASVSGKLSGHSHNDKCSWVLRYGDREIFVDPGTWMYNSPEETRKDFRSSMNHNVLVVDGAEQSCRNLLHSFSRIEDIDSGMSSLGINGLEMWHTGYSRLNGVGTVRRILEFAESKIKVTDIVDGHGKHKLVIVYILHPQLEVSLDSTAPSVLHLNRGIVSIENSSTCSLKLTSCFYSDSYGEKEKTTKIEIDLGIVELPYKNTHTIMFNSSIPYRNNCVGDRENIL